MINQSRFNEKMDALDAANPEPMARLIATSANLAHMTASDIESLIQDLLSSTEHCPARDVIAAALIANMRERLRTETFTIHSVDDALPEPRNLSPQVLVFHSGGVDRGCLYGEAWRHAEYGEDELHGVTHWCELPQRPEIDPDASHEPARDRLPDPLSDDGGVVLW